jgi:hypothetical protein
MKRKLLILCILFTCTLAGNPHIGNGLIIEYEPPYNPFKTLSLAVGIVESKSNPVAYNARERAVGIYQIRQGMLTDFNQATHQSYTLTDMYDISLSNEVFIWHCMKYHPSEIETICRTWNGGPKGKEKESTKKYFEEVKKHLDMISD